MCFWLSHSAWDGVSSGLCFPGEGGTLAEGRRGSVPARLTIHQCNVQASANVVFHVAHEAGKESREHNECGDALEMLMPVKLWWGEVAVDGKITRSGSKEIYLNFFNHKYTVMGIDMLGRDQTCPLEGQASHDCLVPAMCCLHHVFKAYRGSHHICSTTDDLEGKIILGAALLVPTLVPGQLLT